MAATTRLRAVSVPCNSTSRRGTHARLRRRSVSGRSQAWSARSVGVFLTWCPAIRRKQPVEHLDRAADIRPLVEHDALGPRRHRRVGHLAARGQAFLDQVLEHLRRPDHRDMRRPRRPT